MTPTPTVRLTTVLGPAQLAALSELRATVFRVELAGLCESGLRDRPRGRALNERGDALFAFLRWGDPCVPYAP